MARLREWGNVGLKNILGPKYLDLVVGQVQDNVDPTNIQNPRYLDLAISQIKGNDHPSLGTPRGWPFFIDVPKGMIILPWI